MGNQVIYDQVRINGDILKIAIEKIFKPMLFVIDVEASKTTPYRINNNQKKFQFNYELHYVWIRAETNNLVGTIIQINDKFYPEEIFFIDPTNDFAVQQHESAYGRDFFRPETAFADTKKYHLFVDLPKDWVLRFFPYNTHSTAQMLYVNFIGYEKTTRIIREEINEE